MRNERGQWKKGISGNPKGRPRQEDELVSTLNKSLTSHKRQKLVDTILTIAFNKSEESQTRLKAINKIFDIRLRTHEFNRKMEIEERLDEIERRLSEAEQDAKNQSY